MLPWLAFQRVRVLGWIVPVVNQIANVVMMQAAEDGPRFDAPEDVNWSPRWRILVQGQVCSAPIVVGRITAQQVY